jgi:uridine phosphorylase
MLPRLFAAARVVIVSHGMTDPGRSAVAEEGTPVEISFHARLGTLGG